MPSNDDNVTRAAVLTTHTRDKKSSDNKDEHSNQELPTSVGDVDEPPDDTDNEDDSFCQITILNDHISGVLLVVCVDDKRNQ